MTAQVTTEPVAASGTEAHRLPADAPGTAMRRLAGVVVVDGLRRARAAPRRRRSTRRLAHLLPHVHAALGSGAVPPPTTLAKPRVLYGTSDIAVARLAHDGGRTLAMVKLARTVSAGVELEKQHAVLATLRSDRRLADWNHLVPSSTLQRVEGDVFSLESALPGVDAASVLRRRPALRESITRLGLDAIGVLHRRTAAVETLGRSVVDAWLESPLALLHTTHPSGTVSRAQHRATTALEHRLRMALTDRETTLSWIHGDFTPGNVLLGADASSVTGIVDWGQARPAGLPALDAVLWILALDAGRRGEAMGRVVGRALAWRDWPEGDPLVGLAATALGARELDPADLVLLSWLYHVADNLRNTDRYARHRWWWSANVAPVLESVGP